MKKIREKIIFFDEIILIGAGVCILVSVLILSETQDFTFWWIAKFLYIVGVIIHLLTSKVELGDN